jgi:multiple antibiotic resistance protein
MGTMIALILTKAFQLFLVLDPFGNTGIVATLLANYDRKSQRRILFRELLIAAFILMLVFFLGSYLLFALEISQAAITITGGIIFFFFSISLLFPESSAINLKDIEEEPFIVPIATPLVVGPSSIATVILFSNEAQWHLSLAAIGLAWFFTSIIILLGPIFVAKIGKSGVHVMERMIGMICALVAVKMLLKGFKLFIII